MNYEALFGIPLLFKMSLDVRNQIKIEYRIMTSWRNVSLLNLEILFHTSPIDLLLFEIT